MDTEMLMLCLFSGICGAATAFFGRRAWNRALDRIERDLEDRLRALHAKPNRLRGWIYVWLGILFAVFVALWLTTDGLTLPLMTALCLAAGPWYLIRRMAAQRKQKIEDQLADAMVMFSAAIRAGLSLAQALELLAME